MCKCFNFNARHKFIQANKIRFHQATRYSVNIDWSVKYIQVVDHFNMTVNEPHYIERM